MRKCSLGAVLAALFVLLLVSCQRESMSPKSSADDPGMGVVTPHEPLDVPEWPTQKYLEYWYWAGDHEHYDVISEQVTDHRAEFVLSGVPITWAAAGRSDCVFTLTFDAGAIPSWVETVWLFIPQYQDVPAPGLDCEPVLRIEPDMVLDGEVHFDVPQPPWLPGESSYAKFCVWHESRDPDLYLCSDYDRVEPDDIEDPRMHIRWSANHCSQWALDNGKGSSPHPDEE